MLRDYLTDLFPILELGTSAKMLSIVRRLLAGGALLETGAGGSAPRHVRQFLSENHLRWDSLGEFLAVVPALELLAGEHRQSSRARLLAGTPRAARRGACSRRTARRRAASAKLDTRGSHFYLERSTGRSELAAQQYDDSELAARFAPLARAPAPPSRRLIVAELGGVQELSPWRSAATTGPIRDACRRRDAPERRPSTTPSPLSERRKCAVDATQIV